MPLLTDRLGRSALRRIKKLVPASLGGAKDWIWNDSAGQYAPGGFKAYWETLDAIARYQMDLMIGDPAGDIYDYLLRIVEQRAGNSGLRALCIGCAEMSRPEAKFHRSGLFREIVVMDIAEGLLKKQEALAKAEGLPIRYVVTDLNRATLPANTYDFVWALGTLHHVERLDAVFAQINATLTEPGLFATREYIGPDRLQWTDAQLDVVEALLALVPVEYRRQQNGRVKNLEKRPTLRDVIKSDPSEAVRSSALAPALRAHLDVIRWADTGGTVLHLLLNGIANNFEGDPRRDACLQNLIRVERSLVDGGLLPSDYMFCTAQKRKS